MKATPKYNVATIRASGLEAKWSRNSAGAPIIIARNPNGAAEHQRVKWWYVDRHMWDAMKASGILAAFDSFTLLGGLFSVSVTAKGAR